MDKLRELEERNVQVYLSDLILNLINVIIGCTLLICGTILLFLLWPIGLLVQILGISIIFRIIDVTNSILNKQV